MGSAWASGAPSAVTVTRDTADTSVRKVRAYKVAYLNFKTVTGSDHVGHQVYSYLALAPVTLSISFRYFC